MAESKVQPVGYGVAYDGYPKWDIYTTKADAIEACHKAVDAEQCHLAVVTTLYTAEQIAEAVEAVRNDVVTRCPPGFSAYEGGEHDASLFERGFDAFAHALLARFGSEENGS